MLALQLMEAWVKVTPGVGAIMADIVHEQAVTHHDASTPTQATAAASAFVAQWLAHKSKQTSGLAGGLLVKARLLKTMHVGLTAFAGVVRVHQQVRAVAAVPRT